jgi:hypothetical protein
VLGFAGTKPPFAVLLDVLCHPSRHIESGVAIVAAKRFLANDPHEEIEKFVPPGWAEVGGMADGTHRSEARVRFIVKLVWIGCWAYLQYVIGPAFQIVR